MDYLIEFSNQLQEADSYYLHFKDMETIGAT